MYVRRVANEDEPTVWIYRQLSWFLFVSLHSCKACYWIIRRENEYKDKPRLRRVAPDPPARVTLYRGGVWWSSFTNPPFEDHGLLAILKYQIYLKHPSKTINDAQDRGMLLNAYFWGFASVWRFFAHIEGNFEMATVPFNRRSLTKQKSGSYWNQS